LCKSHERNMIRARTRYGYRLSVGWAATDRSSACSRKVRRVCVSAARETAVQDLSVPDLNGVNGSRSGIHLLGVMGAVGFFIYDDSGFSECVGGLQLPSHQCPPNQERMRSHDAIKQSRRAGLATYSAAMVGCPAWTGAIRGLPGVREANSQKRRQGLAATANRGGYRRFAVDDTGQELCRLPTQVVKMGRAEASPRELAYGRLSTGQWTNRRSRAMSAFFTGSSPRRSQRADCSIITGDFRRNTGKPRDGVPIPCTKLYMTGSRGLSPKWYLRLSR